MQQQVIRPAKLEFLDETRWHENNEKFQKSNLPDRSRVRDTIVVLCDAILGTQDKDLQRRIARSLGQWSEWLANNPKS